MPEKPAVLVLDWPHVIEVFIYPDLDAPEDRHPKPEATYDPKTISAQEVAREWHAKGYDVDVA